MAEQRNDRQTGESGPFPGPQGRERVWQAGETEGGPFPMRADTTGVGPSARRVGGTASTRGRHWGRRTSDRPRRQRRSGPSIPSGLRKPLIGLAIAGVAAPILNAGVRTPGAAEPAGQASGEALETSPDADVDRDLEAEVGEYWAEAEADVVRSQTIEGAVTRYRIDGELSEKIYDYATKHDIEPDVAYGLVFTESTFRERAVSHVGARGLTQLMPRTAQWLDPGVSLRDLYDPDVNLDLGFAYLKQLIEKYDGDLEKALTAYNRGPGTVDRILRQGGNPDNGYAGKVMAG